MLTLPLLLILLILWTTLCALTLVAAPALGIDLFAVFTPTLALIAAARVPAGWRAPSFAWIPAIAAVHAVVRVAMGTGNEWHAAGLLAGAIAVGVGCWLGWETGARGRRLENAIDDLVHAAPLVPEVRDAANGAMRGEVRRARRHHRPLSIISLTAERPSRQDELERILAELRRSALDRYTEARLASLLARRMDGSSVLARDDDHFVLLLTETDRSAAQQAVARIEHEFSKELGISVRCGISSFPDEESTLAGLLESAELEMRRSQGWAGAAREPAES